MKNIISVAERRMSPGILKNARKLLRHIQSLKPVRKMSAESQCVDLELLNTLYSEGISLADSLIIRTLIEIREILFPLPEIKRDARKFGNEFISDYFHWKDPDVIYSPETLMGILENDLNLLNTARDILRKDQYSASKFNRTMS